VVVIGQWEHVVMSALRSFLPGCSEPSALGNSPARRWVGWYGKAEEVKGVGSEYRIESDLVLASDWLPSDAFSRTYEDRAAAIATAIEGVDDPAVQEVRVVDVGTGTVVWRSTDDEYE
jgi:hypothetical protein